MKQPAKLVHDRGHHALEDFQDGNCFPLSSCLNRGSLELSVVITNLRLSRKEVMTFITTEKRVVHFAKHRYTRVYLLHAAVTHNCVNSLNSTETPSCSRDIEDGLQGADGWQPKSPRNSIWQGRPACWGTTGVPTMSSRAKVQSQPRSRPRWGNGRSRAQWNFQTTSVIFASHNTDCSVRRQLQQLAVHVVRTTNRKHVF